MKNDLDLDGIVDFLQEIIDTVDDGRFTDRAGWGERARQLIADPPPPSLPRKATVEDLKTRVGMPPEVNGLELYDPSRDEWGVVVVTGFDGVYWITLGREEIRSADIGKRFRVTTEMAYRVWWDVLPHPGRGEYWDMGKPSHGLADGSYTYGADLWRVTLTPDGKIGSWDSPVLPSMSIPLTREEAEEIVRGQG